MASCLIGFLLLVLSAFVIVSDSQIMTGPIEFVHPPSIGAYPNKKVFTMGSIESINWVSEDSLISRRIRLAMYQVGAGGSYENIFSRCLKSLCFLIHDCNISKYGEH